MNKKKADFILTPTSEELDNERIWIAGQIKKIGDKKIKELCKTVVKAKKNGYRPYSNYPVGAAVLSVSGKIYGGANSEVASYSETVHGEEAAIVGAISAGEIQKSGRKFIRALAVYGSGIVHLGPCGACRQRIQEHADNCLIIRVDPKGKVMYFSSLRVQLPYSFGPSNLGIK